MTSCPENNKFWWKKYLKSSRKYKNFNISCASTESFTLSSLVDDTRSSFSLMISNFLFFHRVLSQLIYFKITKKKTFLLALLLWCYIERQWDIKLKKIYRLRKIHCRIEKNIIARVSEWEKEGKINIYLLPSDEDKSL